VGDGGGRPQLGDVVHCCGGGHTESALTRFGRIGTPGGGGRTERLDVDGLVTVASAHPLQHALIDRTCPPPSHLSIYFMDLKMMNNN
jgi:hypothetical protein